MLLRGKEVCNNAKKLRQKGRGSSGSVNYLDLIPFTKGFQYTSQIGHLQENILHSTQESHPPVTPLVLSETFL